MPSSEANQPWKLPVYPCKVKVTGVPGQTVSSESTMVPGFGMALGRTYKNDSSSLQSRFCTNVLI